MILKVLCCYFQMPPVNDVPEAGGEAAVNGDNGDEPRPFKFTFPSHQFHMVHLAKMCQENKDYTDCVIRIGEEELRAHRLVLGSVSPFLKLVFSDLPSTHTEATILVPGVRKRVVKNLLDFFYTGQMTVERQDTSDLQLLIDTLQIDPGLITVDAVTAADKQDEPNEDAETEETKEPQEESQPSETASDRRKRKAEESDDESTDAPSMAKKSNVEPKDEDEEASK